MPSRVVTVLPDPSASPATPSAPANAPEAPPVEVTINLPESVETPSLTAADNETISVDFPDEDIRSIITNVADLYGLNVVVPQALVGRVTIKLRNVTWQQVFKVILEPIGYTFVEDENIIKIVTKAELAQEPVDTRVFIINFARAAELQPSIDPLVDPAAGGRIQVDTRSNSLVITERPSRMNRIQAIIERLDKPTDQVMIESKFVEVTNRDVQDLGVNWSSLSGFRVGAGPFTREYTANDGKTRSESFGSTNRNSFDNTESVTEQGVTFNESLAQARSTNILEDILYSAAEGRVDSAVFSADAFGLILSALDSTNDVELVSNPTVVTMNNTAATINIGEEFPVPEYTFSEERGTFEVSGFTFKPIGILLNVTPQVNSAGFINLDIEPEISSRTGTVNFGGAGGAEIPIVTTRKTKSTVTIKSGFTLAIGGLIERTSGKTVNKVPILGDIPLIGRAFRHDADSEDKRNLIIFITARVLNPDGSTYRDVFSQRTLYEMGIKKRDLPGYTPPPSEENLFNEIQDARDTLDRLQAESRLRYQMQQLSKDKTAEEKRAVDGPRDIPRRNKP